MFKNIYHLPVSDITVNYSVLTNAHFFDIIRYIADNNNTGLHSCLDAYIQSIVDVPLSKITNIDKFCLLLDIRSMFVGDSLELKTGSGSVIKTRVSTMHNNVISALKPNVLMRSTSVGDVDITLSIPRSMNIVSYDQLIEQSIMSVTHDGVIHWFGDFTTQEQQTFMNSLPADVVHHIDTHIKNIQHNNSELMLLPDNKDIGLEGMSVGIYNNSMIEVIKSLYGENLMNFYELQFSLITKMNVSYDHFMKMTPNESRIYINLYNKDIKKQEEATSKQNQQHNHGKGAGGI